MLDPRIGRVSPVEGKAIEMFVDSLEYRQLSAALKAA